MKAKTARTLLMAGTIIGGVMYFSQTAKAQDTRLQTMTTENRMLYNTKEQLAQQVTDATNEFNRQAGLESAMSTAARDLLTTVNTRGRLTSSNLTTPTLQGGIGAMDWLAVRLTNDAGITLNIGDEIPRGINLPSYTTVAFLGSKFYPAVNTDVYWADYDATMQEIADLDASISSQATNLRNLAQANNTSLSFVRNNALSTVI